MDGWHDDPELDDPFLPRDPETGDPDPTGEAPPVEWPHPLREWRLRRKQLRKD
jgi:hypothetical protein